MPDPHHSARTHSDSRCRALFARMSEYLDNELDGPLCREVEAHLEQCPPCRVCLATLRRTVALCREAGTAAVPASLARRLRALVADLSGH